MPTAEQPLRLAEFDELFATAARHVDQLDAVHARLRLVGPSGLASNVRELTARETECYAFFAFTVTVQPGDDGEMVPWVVDARCDSLTNCTCPDCPVPDLTNGTT
ncbi:hypothetical protein ACWER9_06965 [Micromonospora sp. NPDC003944]